EAGRGEQLDGNLAMGLETVQTPLDVGREHWSPRRAKYGPRRGVLPVGRVEHLHLVGEQADQLDSLHFEPPASPEAGRLVAPANARPAGVTQRKHQVRQQSPG